VDRGSANGLVLVTSRVGAAPAWGATCVLHEVPSLSPAEGARILIDVAGDRAGGVQQAAVLAGLLAGVPLAIRQAARYLASSAAALDGIKTFHAYGEALESRFLALLEASPGSTSPRDSVLLTWEISLDRLERHGMRDARWIMRLLGEFADAPIPSSMIHSEILGRGRLLRLGNGLVAEHPRLLGRWRRAVGFRRDEHRGVRTLTALVEVGLLDLTADSVACVVAHPLVRRHSDALVMDDRPLHKDLFTAAVAIVRGTTAELNPQDPAASPALAMLAPHLERMLNRCAADASLGHRAAVVDAANVVAHALYTHGDYVRACSLSASTVAFARRVLPAGHRVLLAAEHAYGRALVIMGRLSSAAVFLRSLAETKRRRLGARDRDTLRTVFNLAYVQRELGEVNEALATFRHLLGVYREDLGEDHELTLRVRTYVAETIALGGDLGRARTELEDVRQRCRKLPSSDERLILHVAKILVRTLTSMELLEEAEVTSRQLLDDAAAVYAGDHPEMLDIRHDLAVVRARRGSVAEAESMLTDILEARRNHLGAGHPDAVSTEKELARLRSRVIE
jgi:tetratricopeptide (TPR) repeat protein